MKNEVHPPTLNTLHSTLELLTLLKRLVIQNQTDNKKQDVADILLAGRSAKRLEKLDAALSICSLAIENFTTLTNETKQELSLLISDIRAILIEIGSDNPSLVREVLPQHSQ